MLAKLSLSCKLTSLGNHLYVTTTTILQGSPARASGPRRRLRRHVPGPQHVKLRILFSNLADREAPLTRQCQCPHRQPLFCWGCRERGLPAIGSGSKVLISNSLRRDREGKWFFGGGSGTWWAFFSRELADSPC